MKLVVFEKELIITQTVIIEVNNPRKVNYQVRMTNHLAKEVDSSSQRAYPNIHEKKSISQNQ